MPRSGRPNTLVLGRFVVSQDRQERLVAKRRARRIVRVLYYAMKVVGVAACIYTSGLNATLVYMRPDFGRELLVSTLSVRYCVVYHICFFFSCMEAAYTRVPGVERGLHVLSPRAIVACMFVNLHDD